MYDPGRHAVWADYKNIHAKMEERHSINLKLSGDVYELKNDIEHKIQIMRELEYIDSENQLLLKGNIISNVENPMDIVIVEALFRGVFSRLEVNEIPPVISLFVSESVAKLDRRYVNEGVV
jgi:superfamily II RNA helicase